jgi:DNA-binding GntR family transcriptional regulator
LAVRSQAAPKPAYRTVADALRLAILEREDGDEQRLPTEAELSLAYGVSRQTVRRAYQDLVADGIIYRVPGRGTFPTHRLPYLRSIGSIDDLMALSLDTELHVVEPLQMVEAPAAAVQLGLEFDKVMQASFVRHHEGLPFCHTTVALPPELGQRMHEVDFLRTPGAQSRQTIIALIEHYSEQPINGAKQTINAMPAPAAIAPLIEVTPGAAILWIERLYFDVSGRPIELATNYFHPDRYSYQLRLRRTGR